MKDLAPRYIPLIKASAVDSVRGGLSRQQLNMNVDHAHDVLDANKINGIAGYGYAIDGLLTESYQTYFARIEQTVSTQTGLKGIEAILKRLKSKNGGIVHAADFMGRGLFIHNHPQWKRHITSITGVSNLVPNKSWDTVATDSLNTHVVAADLYTYNGWATVANQMNQEHIPAFNIAWCRPMGPFNISVGHSWDRLGNSDIDFLALDVTDFFSYMLGCMDKADSILFTQLPVKLGAHANNVALSIQNAGYKVVVPEQLYPNGNIKMAVWRGLD